MAAVAAPILVIRNSKNSYADGGAVGTRPRAGRSDGEVVRMVV